MEKINENPRIIFDGGHNESAIKNLQQNIEQYYENNKRVYIVSILKTKDYSTIIKEVSKDKDGLYYFTNGIKEKPYVDSNVLAEEAKKYINKDNIKVKELEEAIKEAKEKYNERTIFIIGSFYIYKKVKEILERGKYDKN